MKAAMSLTLLSALITVLTCKIQINTFVISGESLTMEMDDMQVISGAVSKLHCAAICDQYSWCIAISWLEMKKTCQGFTRTLTPEATPAFDHYKASFVGQGYKFTAGMRVKFFSNPSLSWHMAQDYCVNDGGRLAVLDTLEKYNAVISDPVVQGLSNWWIGTTKVNGVWTMTTGSEIDAQIPVKEDSGDANCLGIFASTLSDSNCNWNTGFLCEK